MFSFLASQPFHPDGIRRVTLRDTGVLAINTFLGRDAKPMLTRGSIEDLIDF